MTTMAIWIFSQRGNRVEMYRNNSDGIFSDVSDQTFIPSERPGARDAGFGDFDDDGDIDLLITNDGSGCTLYTNLRQGKAAGVD